MLHIHVASASADRNVRVDLATLVGFGLAALAFYAGVRNLSFVHLLLEMPYVKGIDLVFSAPDVLTSLVVPAIGLLVLAVALGYAAVFDRGSIALVVVLTTALLYWSAGVAFAATAIVLAGVFGVLDVVSGRTRARGN